MKRLVSSLLVVSCFLVVFSGCGQIRETKLKQKLVEAQKIHIRCKLSHDGLSLSFNAPITDSIPEINKVLGIPDSVYDKMQHTRALDGRQEQKTADFTVSWTYHPDDGLNVLWEINQ
jgi:hypothetical protein